MKNNKKQLLITRLIEDDIDMVRQNIIHDDVYWLGLILENGFCGYKHQTYHQLKKEAEARCLLN